eukprot:s5776_g2.t1
MPTPLISRAFQVRDCLASISHHHQVVTGPSHPALDKSQYWMVGYILSYLNRGASYAGELEGLMPTAGFKIAQHILRVCVVIK